MVSLNELQFKKNADPDPTVGFFENTGRLKKFKTRKTLVHEDLFLVQLGSRSRRKLNNFLIFVLKEKSSAMVNSKYLDRRIMPSTTVGTAVLLN